MAYVDRTIKQKIFQIAWAIYDEVCHSKAEILNKYLQTVYWGSSYYGIDAAVQGYFNSNRSDLSVAQSFFLVERLAKPNSVSFNRIQTLLARPQITVLFNANETAVNELVGLYEKHFKCGGMVWQQFLAKYPTQLDTRIVRSWSDVSNAQ